MLCYLFTDCFSHPGCRVFELVWITSNHTGRHKGTYCFTHLEPMKHQITPSPMPNQTPHGLVLVIPGPCFSIYVLHRFGT